METKLIQKFGKCPECGSENIRWDSVVKLSLWNNAYSKAACKDCGCQFKEHYQYMGSEIINIWGGAK